MLLAAACAMGALWARPFPWVVVGAVLLGGLVARRPWLVVLGAALLTSALGSVAIAGARPVEAGSFDQVATLVTDPVTERGGQRAEIRASDGPRFEVHARGALGAQLGKRLAGERIAVQGRREPRPAHATWLMRRHVVGRVDAESIRFVDDGDLASRAANAFRRLLLRGASSLPEDERALFTGFVLGDDRAERPEVIDDFRASGLSHLLAVSGENVAFVLIAARPLLRRLELRGRFVVSVALLAFFAFATRLEPSVLRATAMALISVTASTTGRPISGLRTLSLAVAALLVIDPLLVGAVGFQLSVSASAGIIVCSSWIAERLPGPRPLRELLAVTLAAQLGVAPVLLGVFTSMPVATFPANLLAVPAAGPVMVWGLTGGVVAGMVGGPIAAAIHVPTHLLLWWVKSVARVAATVPMGEMNAWHVAFAAVGGALALHGAGVHSAGRRLRRWAALLALAGIAAHLVVTRPAPVGFEVALGRGATLFNGAGGEAVLVMDGSAAPAEILRGLRRNGVTHLDAVVARSAGWAARATLETVRARTSPALVIQPGGGTTAGSVVAVGGLDIVVHEDEPRLRVTVRGRSPAPATASHRGRPSWRLGVASARGPPRRPRDLAFGCAPRPDRARAGPAPLRHHVAGDRDGHPQPHARLVLRQGQLLGFRRVPGQGRQARGRRRRLPRRRWGQGRPR